MFFLHSKAVEGFEHIPIAVKYLQSGDGESAIVCAANTNLWCGKIFCDFFAPLNYYLISRPGTFGFAK